MRGKITHVWIDSDVVGGVKIWKNPKLRFLQFLKLFRLALVMLCFLGDSQVAILAIHNSLEDVEWKLVNVVDDIKALLSSFVGWDFCYTPLD